MTAIFPQEQFTLTRVIRPDLARPNAARLNVIRRGEYGRTFDLHPAIFAMSAGAYLAYVGIMALAFAEANADLAIPFVIFALFIVAGFGTPALFARIAPPPPGNPPRWATFMRDGFDCMTGHVSVRGALVQILIMPALLLFWGLSVAIIVACLR